MNHDISHEDYTVVTRNIYEDGLEPVQVKRLMKYLKVAIDNNGFITTTKGINDQKIFRLQQLIENLK